jgi:hypothetical protein
VTAREFFDNLRTGTTVNEISKAIAREKAKTQEGQPTPLDFSAERAAAKKKWDETEIKQWDPMEDVENLKKKYNTKSTGLISKNMAS